MIRITAAFLPALLAFCLGVSACSPVIAPNQTQPGPGIQSPEPALSRIPSKTSPTVSRSLVPATQSAITIHSNQLRGVEVRFWHPWSGNEAQVVNALTDEFNRDNIWGLRVIPTAAGGSGEVLEQVNASLRVGRPPSLVAAPIDHLLYWQQTSKAVIDLNPYTGDPDWGLTDQEVKDFNPIFWQQDLMAGRRLGIPAERAARVLVYNSSWAKELGFDKPPATLTDFQKQVCAAAKANAQDGLKANNGTGGWIFDRDALTLMSWMRASGMQIPDTSVRYYQFNTPEAAKAFDFMRKMYDLGCAWNSRNPLPYEYFATRAALVYSGGLEDVDLQEHTQERLKSADTWQVIPFPSASGQPVILAGGPSYAILQSNPEEQMGAWLFIRWMILARNQIRLVEASGTLPVSTSALAGLAAYADKKAHWKQVLEYLPLLSPAPALPDWWLARNILEDAGWQLLQITPQPAQAVLQQLDDTISEILKHQP